MNRTHLSLAACAALAVALHGAPALAAEPAPAPARPTAIPVRPAAPKPTIAGTAGGEGVKVLPMPAPAVAVAPSGPPGKAEFPETVYDAGISEKGADVRHEFIVKNVGTNPLTIDAKPGCGCTVTEFDKLIEPGKQGKVVATVHTANFSGPITKSITVTTNDPNNATVALQIKANITTAMEVTPGDSVAFSGRYDELKPQKVVIASADKSVFDVSSATVADSSFGVVVAAAPESGDAPKAKPGTVASGANRYEVTINPPSAPQVGRLNTQVELKTTHPKGSSIPIRVFGNVSGDITFSPATVMVQVGASATSEQKTATILLQKMTGDPLKITSVTSDKPDLKVSYKTIEDGRRFEITVKYAGDPMTTALNARVTVATNDKHQPTVDMQVWGRADAPPTPAVMAAPDAPRVPAAAPAKP